MTTNEFVVKHIIVETGCKYDIFIEAMEAHLGVHNPNAYQHLLTDNSTLEEGRKVIASQAGPFGLMAFAKLPMGALFVLESRKMRAHQYLIGNPLIALSMMRYNIRAGLYAPLRVLVHADAAGNAIVEYDQPSALFGSIGDARIDEVGVDLDNKMAMMLEAAHRNIIDPRRTV